MSRGYSGYAHLAQANETRVIYTYCCYNVNLPDHKHFMNMEDSELYIDRNAFVEQEIHKRIIKTASGRKKNIVKRITRDVSFDELFKEGKIKVKNTSGTWRTVEFGFDIIALNIMFKIFHPLSGGIFPFFMGLSDSG